MSKAKRTFVDWLKPGERGWVERDGTRWKWDGTSMWYQLARRVPSGAWRTSEMRVAIIECALNCTEVFPRPAPRRAVKVRAWAVVGPCGTNPMHVWWVEKNIRAAKRLARECDTVMKLTGEYTPKSKGAKR